METEANNTSIESLYHAYISALNTRPFPGLSSHMHPTVYLNDTAMALPEYEKLLTTDIDAGPDLLFKLHMLLVNEEKGQVGCRIEFTCTPLSDEYMGRQVRKGRKVGCMEHMFYQYREGRIERVWWMPGEVVELEGNTTEEDRG
ncbi:MAG: hypothetical protein Q9220_002191 [cf. Caloplaca sp. 1 TL-2023]